MAEEKKRSFQKWMTKLAGNSAYRRILVLVGLGLMAVILLSSFFTRRSDTRAETEASAQTVSQTVEDYAAQLEQSLTAMLEQIEGVGKAQVMVTIEKGVENIYATEQKTSKQVTENRSTSSDGRNQENDQVETTYILVKDADGGQRAVAVTQLQPVVKGVVVVCDGGSSTTVQQQVINAVTTALDLSSAKVCVVSAK
ncbi:MAG: stage III sporulation protein AG [Oscillospiraceae bacterium]|nr:stage III sporulation protein AG [Oscillospiraceae bacterium]